MRKVLVFLALFLFLLAVAAWFISRKPSYEPFDATLEQISLQSTLGDSRIIWADAKGKQSEWSIVYLPGLAPHSDDSDPILTKLVAQFGMNVFEAPLISKEIDEKKTEEEITPKVIIDRAKEAISVGQTIGKKVILICNSVSSASCIYLAGRNQNAVDALILYAPVLETNTFYNEDLFSPWSNLKSKIFSSGQRERSIHREEIQAYTYLIQETLNDENYGLISQPYFLSYYFKDEKSRDKNISIESIHRLDSLSQTNSRMKRTIVLDRMGKGSKDKYYGDWQKVYLETRYYIEEVLKVKPKTVL